MWLLNANTITLEEYFENEAPPFAILSHTWDKEEVAFQDLQGPKPKYENKLGYRKIVYTCQQALRDGLGYAWVDTCCIDKSSSAELSEAINSMFRWYEIAAVCYAYLVDVPPNTDLRTGTSWFARSRWFTRGWTLQELLAPTKLVFFSSDWTEISTRNELACEITTITGIDHFFLEDSESRSECTHNGQWSPYIYDATRPSSRSGILFTPSVAERMRWAASRQTTRTEDLAYCLLGIFGIHMPLIYGEGKMAFIRLQEEIIKRSNDQSIFAWGVEHDRYPLVVDSRVFRSTWSSSRPSPSLPSRRQGFLAESPAQFSGTRSIHFWNPPGIRSSFSVTNRGIQMSLPVLGGSEPYVILGCGWKHDPTAMLAIPTFSEGGVWARSTSPVSFVDNDVWRSCPIKTLHFDTRLPSAGSRFVNEPPLKIQPSFNYRMILRDIPLGLIIHEVSPPSLFDPTPSSIVIGGPWNELQVGEEKRVTVTLGKHGTDLKLLLGLSIRKLSSRNRLIPTILSQFLPLWWTSSSITISKPRTDPRIIHGSWTDRFLPIEPRGILLSEGLVYPTITRQKMPYEASSCIDLFIIDLSMTEDPYEMWEVRLRALLSRLFLRSGQVLGQYF